MILINYFKDTKIKSPILNMFIELIKKRKKRNYLIIQPFTRSQTLQNFSSDLNISVLVSDQNFPPAKVLITEIKMPMPTPFAKAK